MGVGAVLRGHVVDQLIVVAVEVDAMTSQFVTSQVIILSLETHEDEGEEEAVVIHAAYRYRLQTPSRAQNPSKSVTCSILA